MNTKYSNWKMWYYVLCTPELVALRLRHEDDEPLRGERQMLDLYRHELRAAERPRKAEEDQRAVAQGDDVIPEAVRQHVERLHEDRRLALLERALLAPYRLHRRPHERILRRIVLARVAGRHVVLRDGRHAARHRIRLRIIREVVEVVDDRLRPRRQVALPVVMAPVREIAPVRRIRLERVVRLRLAEARLRLLREMFILLNALVLDQQEILLCPHSCPFIMYTVYTVIFFYYRADLCYNAMHEIIHRIHERGESPCY